MQNIVVFSNPNSRENRKDKSKVKTIRKLIGNNGLVCNTKSANSLEKIVAELPKWNPNVIIVSGGDGTVASVLTNLVAYWPPEREIPPLGVIPSGTINILAKECAAPKKNGGLSRLLVRPFSSIKNLFNGNVEFDYIRNIINMTEKDLFYRDVDFMKVSDNHDTTVYGFSVGTGLVISMLNEYYKAKHLKLAKISSMLVHMVGSAFINNRYYQSLNEKHPLSINGGEPEDYLAIMAQTVQSIGMPKSSPFYKAQLSAGKFHVLGHKFEFAKFLRYAPAFYFGDEVPGMLDVQTENFIISSEKEFVYQVNGELDYMGKELKANILKIEHGIRCKIIQPRTDY